MAKTDGFLSAEYTLINTINNAAFNPKPLSETQPRCPTGNCTWPPFTSLGFCFKCQDVSQPVRESSTYVDRFEYSNSSAYPPGSFPAGTARGRRNYTWRTYTYEFPELNGQILRTSPIGSRQHSFSTTFETSEGLNPAFFVCAAVGPRRCPCRRFVRSQLLRSETKCFNDPEPALFRHS